MREILAKYVPNNAVDSVIELIKKHRVHFKIVNQRHTRHGDYTRLPDGSHRITVNSSSNPYRFLITTIHELAHLVAIETYGREIKPHGQEWKYTFTKMILPYLNDTIFPEELLPLLYRHFKNPKASSDTDALLSMALKKYDPPTSKVYIDELPIGAIFRTSNGRIFRKERLIVKRTECRHLQSNRIYLFQPNTQVELLKSNEV